MLRNSYRDLEQTKFDENNKTNNNNNDNSNNKQKKPDLSTLLVKSPNKTKNDICGAFVCLNAIFLTKKVQN